MYIIITKDLDEVYTSFHETLGECKLALEDELCFYTVDNSEEVIYENTVIYKVSEDQKVSFKFENNKAVL